MLQTVARGQQIHLWEVLVCDGAKVLFSYLSEQKLELSSTLASYWVTALKMGGNNTADHIDRGNKQLPWLDFCDVTALKIQPVKAASR